ncbi:uncharacterized protein EV420DRAFT_1536760 [Desarmillaria tabescens]|uniref:U4/U6.U5 small nuclear ribonucleoprotein 27kDa protein domain-containing protein n=1 Tax=Armillaria tabescens TaxID=1929756 RepID=A0AA39KH11_ARMTA|nr:uncharacterized protein EV420DRAFT_1536760 [Desarmillaria tabescens]KAK0459594.1 hypothetical protein EV420DRAFT_1536760 [Desarmillaria tabescens]
MSSRGDHRRRDRSWERDSRDRDRYSRKSRSPRRDRDRRSRNGDRRFSFHSHSTDQVPQDYRDYGRDREDTRRDRERGDRDRDRDYKPRDGPRDRDDVKSRGESSKLDDSRRSDKPREPVVQKDSVPNDTESRTPRSTRPNLDPDAPDDVQNEAIDDPDEEAMMAMMGLGGFGSTKGKHVDGNQEGATNCQEDSRGGFNRPLDKIK